MSRTRSKRGVLKWRDAREWLESRNGPSCDAAFDRMDRILKAGAATRPTELPDDILASAFRTAAIGILVPATFAAFKERYDEIMRGAYTAELVKDCDDAGLLKHLKALGRERVYCTPSNLRLELMGRRVICGLMDLFWEGASVLPIGDAPSPNSFPGKIGALLSENYRRVFRHFVKSAPELPEPYHRFQLVTDYVCGMTDSFAKRLHSELTCG